MEKVKASMSEDWRKDPVPFPSYLLTNNNANIRRVRQRIEELSHKTEFVGWTFPGGEARSMRRRTAFGGLLWKSRMPIPGRRSKARALSGCPAKEHGQRQLNQNAIRAAARLNFLRPEDGKSPYQLQPFAKRAEKECITVRRFYGHNQGYAISSVIAGKRQRLCAGHHPTAPSPYVTWACYDDKDGQRQYEWGHYGSDRAALEQDFAARVQEYPERL